MVNVTSGNLTRQKSTGQRDRGGGGGRDVTFTHKMNVLLFWGADFLRKREAVSFA